MCRDVDVAESGPMWLAFPVRSAIPRAVASSSVVMSRSWAAAAAVAAARCNAPKTLSRSGEGDRISGCKAVAALMASSSAAFHLGQP